VEVSKGYGKTIRDISPSGIIELQKVRLRLPGGFE
jgi:hypothetical protein